VTTPLENYEYYAARVDRINAVRAHHLILRLVVALIIVVLVLAAITGASNEIAQPGTPDSLAKAAADISAREDSVHYRNCAEARAAGVAPIYEGQPGYREGLDGDDDGIACEPYHPR
jgi:hypothetical protein